MSKQLITLTPLEPWFFGTDRTFRHPDRELQRDGGYYIRSADTPSQTTLFGVLRYLGIENPSADFSLSDDAKGRIGEESFMLCKDNQTFGKIESISPLYLLDSEDRFYVPTPFDHDGSKDEYSPFSEYTSVQTNHGNRLLPKSYEEKSSLAGGWMCLDDLTIHTNLFQSIVGVGIDKKKSDEAFFKREKKAFLPPDPKKPNEKRPNRFAFIAYADFNIPERIVYLGQQKSAFLAKTETLEPPCITFMDENIAYAQSDLFIKNPKVLYSACELVIAKLTATRPFVTKYNTDGQNCFSTHHNLLYLIQAGSVFRPINVKLFKQELQNEHAAIAGFNQIIFGGNV